MPPSIEELENRLRNRQTESEEKVKMRIEKAEKELMMAKKFDVILLNDSLEKSQKEIVDTVKQFLAES